MASVGHSVLCLCAGVLLYIYYANAGLFVSLIEYPCDHVPCMWRPVYVETCMRTADSHNYHCRMYGARIPRLLPTV